MKLDHIKIQKIATPCSKPSDIRPVTVRRCEDRRNCYDVDTALRHIRSQHSIHIGLPIEMETILYGIVKALSELYDRDDWNETCDCWPAIDVEHFEEATANWVRRAELIGDDPVFWFEQLKNLGLLKIYRRYKIVYFQLTAEAVFRILNFAGLTVEKGVISD